MTIVSEYPLVSIVVPCFNEVDFIELFISNAFKQDYKNFEIIIADGDSDDGTKDLLDQLCSKYVGLEVVNNQARIVSSGLNLAIEKAAGSIIVRFDVHTSYDVTYISHSVQLLNSGKYDCVGGAWNIFVPKEVIPRGIALSFKSHFGSGGAKSRSEDYSGEVDTVYLGAWPRDAFSTFGYFDENLVRNQDDELCHRIILGGGTLFQSADIKSIYFGRKTLVKLSRQFYQYGFWKPHVIIKLKTIARLRHLAPSLLVSYILSLTSLGLYSGLFILVAGVSVLAYFLIIFFSTNFQFKKESFWTILAATCAVVIMHFSYGYGFIRGFVSATIGSYFNLRRNLNISR